MSRPKFHKGLLLPRYWPTWLGFGIWWLLAQLPYKLQMFLGSLLGKLMAIVAKRRIAIAKRNIELCFPHLSSTEQKSLLQKHIDSLGKVFFEIGIAWFWSRKRLHKLFCIQGIEHLQKAQEQGRGVILMAVHFSHIELTAACLSSFHSIDGSYKRHENPVYDFIQSNRRRRFNQDSQTIERKDIRLMIKSLKMGRTIWYAPDQDYGIKHSIFLPLFGVEAACLTATSPLSKMGNALLMPMIGIRNKNNGYDIVISPAVENFPTDDLIKDTQLVVSLIERSIMHAPEQYLWVHRRFKNRPEGEPDLYSRDLLRQIQ